MGKRLVAGVTVLCCLLAVGCTPPPPPPPPVSTWTPTPTLSQAERETADYKAAAAAYIEANRIVDEALNAGADEFPPDLTKYADPDREWYKAQVSALARFKVGRATGLTKVVEAYPMPGTVYNSQELTLYVCLDGRETTFVDASGKTSHGNLDAGALVMIRTGERDPATGEATFRVMSRTYGAVTTCKKEQP